jgi:hypothetical protein
MDYGESVGCGLAGQPIATLCSYWLDTCEPDDVLDVLHCHGVVGPSTRIAGRKLSSQPMAEANVYARGAGPNTERLQEITQLMEDLLRTYAGRIEIEAALCTSLNRRPPTFGS